jgi:hypothetical protein
MNTTGTIAATNGFLIPIYVIYVGAAFTLTTWLARTLFHNGATFLKGVFDDSQMADSVNRLLVVGFYMLNLGYALLIFSTDGAADLRTAIASLVNKLGILLASLGAMHFANMYLFFRIRRRATAAELPVPVAPQIQVTPNLSTYGAPMYPPAPSAPSMPRI